MVTQFPFYIEVSIGFTGQLVLSMICDFPRWLRNFPTISSHFQKFPTISKNTWVEAFCYFKPVHGVALARVNKMLIPTTLGRFYSFIAHLGMMSFCVMGRDAEVPICIISRIAMVFLFTADDTFLCAVAVLVSSREFRKSFSLVSNEFLPSFWIVFSAFFRLF